MRAALASALVLLLAGTGAGQSAPPPSGGTLLVYDSPTKPFSMENEIEPVAILLSRFETRLERREAKALKPGDIERAGRVVLVGTGGFPAIDPACLALLKSGEKPLMAVGGASALAAGRVPDDRMRPEALADAEVRYHGSRWPARVDPYFPVPVDSSHVLAGVVTSKLEKPLAFRIGKRFGFSALPSGPTLSMVFSDVLVDFYEVAEAPEASVLFVVDDFHPGCGAAGFRRLVDYFSHHGMPFAVSAQMQKIPEGVEPMPQEEFLEALRYAQSHGGRIFLKGAEGQASAPKFQEAGLQPVGPADSMPADPAAIQIGRMFYQRTPGAEPEPFPLHTPLRLAGGGWLWPANVRGGLDGEHLDGVRSQVRRISSFRGGLAGVVIPAWLPFQSMRDLVDAAREVGIPAVDPLKSVPATSTPQP